MGKAAGQVTSQSLLALVEKGNAVDAARLEEVRQLAAQHADTSTFARHLVARNLLTKWQIQQMLRGVWQLSIGKYRLREERGIGRIGRELTAEHISLGRKVVLKLVSRILTSNPDRLNKFLQDFRKVAAIDHPNLVHSFDVDSEGQRYFVVTEFVDGENIEQRIRREDPLTVEATIPLLIQVAKGLSFAASQGLIHCDLKPSNLVVDGKGNLKVTDLGYGRLIDGSEVNSDKAKQAHDQVFNTGIEYRAPELGENHREVIDPRVDIYSLGQTMFFLLTGAVPDVQLESSDDRKKSLEDRVPGVPGALSQLYAKLTSPDPLQRCSDWNQVLAELEGLQARPASTPARGDVAKESSAGKKKVAAASTAPAKSAALSKDEPVVFPNLNFTEPAAKTTGKTAAAAAKKADQPVAKTPVKNGPLPKAKIEVPVVEEEEEEEIEQVAEVNEVEEDVEEVESTEEDAGEEGEEESADPSPFQFNFAEPAAKPDKKASSAGRKPEATKPAVAAKKSGDGETTDDAQANEKGGAKKKDGSAALPIDVKWLLIGGGVLVALLLITTSLLLYVVLGGSGNKTKEIAKADEKAETGEKVKKSDSKKTAEITADETKKAAAEDPAKTATDPAPSAAAETPPAENIGSEPVVAPPMANTEPEPVPEPMPMPTTPSAENPLNLPDVGPAPQQPAATPPAKNDGPKIEVLDPNTKTPPASTSPPKKDPPKAGTPAGEGPLKDIKSLFLLPEIVADKRHDIGRCPLAGKICVIDMYGGEVAYKGRQAFSLEATTATDWDIKLSGKAGESPSLIAQLHLADDKLQFEWKKNATTQTAAPFLKNCSFRVSVGSESRQIALRAAVKSAPLKVDLDKPSSLKLALEHLPDPKNIRVEVIAPAAAGFPNAKYLPDDEFIPSESNTFIWVGPKENETVLGLKIDAKTTARGLDISYITRIKPSINDTGDAPLVKAKFLKDRKVILDRFSSADIQKKALLDEANKEKDANAKKDKIAKIENEFKLAFQDLADHANRINEMIEALHQKSILHFRIVIDMGSGIDKVVLAETEGSPAAAPAAKK